MQTSTEKDYMKNQIKKILHHDKIKIIAKTIHKNLEAKASL